MKVDLFDQKGKKLKKIELSDEIFATDLNDKVIAQYVYSYLSSQRQSNAHTKDRSEVRGGGKKPWRQKGTGRARFGSSRVPIWRGGGVTFGPTNERNWKKDMNKKFKKFALKNMLTSAMNENKIVIVDTVTIKKDAKLTNEASVLVKNVAGDSKKQTVVTLENDKQVQKAFSNIKNANVVFVKDLNAFDIYSGGTVIFEEGAVKELETRLK